MYSLDVDNILNSVNIFIVRFDCKGLALTIYFVPNPLVDHLDLRILSPTLLEMIIIGFIFMKNSICRLTSAQIIIYAITSPGRHLILRKGPSSETVLGP